MNRSITKHRKLAVIGASGHGKVVADVAKSLSCYDEIAFLDDSVPKNSEIKYIGKCDVAADLIEQYDFIVAIGNQYTRRRITEKLVRMGAFFATLIHKNAVIGSDVVIGSGSVIMAGTVINASSKIGVGCIINTCASVDHDCVLGDYVHIAVGAHLCGTVNVGNDTWIGAGTTVINNISITNDCTVGAGSVVVKNIMVNGMYYGVPAKFIK